jgi:hypothetical protein
MGVKLSEGFIFLHNELTEVDTGVLRFKRVLKDFCKVVDHACSRRKRVGALSVTGREVFLSDVGGPVEDVSHLYLLRVEHTGVDQELIFDLDPPIIEGW